MAKHRVMAARATAARRTNDGSSDESYHSDGRLVVGGNNNSVSAMAEAWLDTKINARERT